MKGRGTRARYFYPGHAEELADIRALVFHEAEEPGADCLLTSASDNHKSISKV